MSFSRKEKILEIIASERISTQQELAGRLNSEGFNVTQATVSRDIRDLGLIKRSEPGLKGWYALPKKEIKLSDRFAKILRETVTDIKTAENLVVVHTLSGCGSPTGEAIDSMGLDDVVGTLAGDNTVLIIVSSHEKVPGVVEKLQRFVQ
ncbi:MAG: arginine repressor [Firmicutes bacterium]|nr:arginine repressor [Bacillota bacterium]MBQ2058423.1 arginine repressor [Bacillota bacterium]MBQ4372466.1 arginine repressor [Bacillota bacterium]